jgi:hypothetical protein
MSEFWQVFGFLFVSIIAVTSDVKHDDIASQIICNLRIEAPPGLLMDVCARDDDAYHIHFFFKNNTDQMT